MPAPASPRRRPARAPLRAVAYDGSTSSSPPRETCLSPQRDAHVLQLRAGEQLVHRLLAADAGLLVAAERHADAVRARIVDPYVTRLHARGEPMRAVEVVRPDRCRQSIIERIDAPQKIVLVRPAEDAHHRAENLLAGDAHVVADVGEHRRL